jgi:hypothetical protein
MAEAEFRTFAPPGFAADAAISGYSQGQSIMQRAQDMRIQRERDAQQSEEDPLRLEAMRTTNEANRVTSLATVQNYNQVQDLRKRFGETAPAAQKEFEDAMQLPSYDDQQRALSVLQQKYNWMSLLPEGKPFVQTVANTRLTAAQSALADRHLNAELTLQSAKHSAMLDEIAAKGTEQRSTYEQIGKGKTREQRLRDEINQMRDDGDEEGANQLSAVLGRLGQARVNRTPGSDIEDIDQRIQAARQGGNFQLAKDLEAKRGLLTTRVEHADPIAALAATLEKMNNKGAAPATAVPSATPTATPAPAAQKPYAIQDGQIHFQVDTKNPVATKDAIRQAYQDGAIDEKQARGLLEQAGFTKK